MRNLEPERLRGKRALSFPDVLQHERLEIFSDIGGQLQDDFGAKDYLIEFPDAGLARRTIEAAGRRLLYGRADFLIADEGLQLTELELVEPSLFFRHCRNAASSRRSRRLLHAP